MSDVVTEDAKPKALGNAAVVSGVVARPTRDCRFCRCVHVTLMVDLSVRGRALGPCARASIRGRSGSVRARTRCREVGGRAAPARLSRTAVAMGGGSGPYADAERQGAVEGISPGSKSHAERGTRRRLAAPGAGAQRPPERAPARSERAAPTMLLALLAFVATAGAVALGGVVLRRRAHSPPATGPTAGRPERITVSERGRSEPERRHAPEGGRAARSRPCMDCDARMAPD